jgi:NADH dehydrogenase/NADH:ubiquinone oxidoreductase subunit G
MGEIKLMINGVEVRGKEGATILDAAKEAEIRIPTLCHSPDLRPVGGCRICVVEVEGSRRLVASCHTPISQGMVIQTHSAKVVGARKAILELLLAGHTGPCVTDGEAKDCELHNLAAELEAGPPRFRVRKPRYYAPEEVSPYVRRDMSKCILCTRCIRACSEIAKKDVFSMAYRGFGSKVVVDCDVPLNKEVCKNCGICIEYCPTSALTKAKKGAS